MFFCGECFSHIHGDLTIAWGAVCVNVGLDPWPLSVTYKLATVNVSQEFKVVSVISVNMVIGTWGPVVVKVSTL